MMKISVLFVVVLFNAFLFSGCSRKRALPARPLPGPETPIGSQQILLSANVIKGKISSITEADGLVGWVCEQDMVGSTALVISAGSNIIPITAIQRTPETDTDAQTQCSNISTLPFRFTVPFANLSAYSDSYVTVYATPSNTPNLQIQLVDSGIYRVPTPSSPTPSSTSASASSPTPSSTSASVPTSGAQSSTGSVNGPLTPAPQYLVTGQSNPGAGGIVSGSSTVVSGQTVSLLAQANPGYSFQSWTNCALPNGSTCIVTANADTMVTANFTIQPIILNIQIPVPGSVTVTGPNISCSQSCSVQLTPGTQLTISATTAYNKKISSWNGCDSVNNNSCVLSLTNARSITVNTTNEYPGPEDVLEVEPGKPAGATPKGYLDGRKGTTAFGGWICQNNVHNSLFVKVYVGTATNDKQTYIGQYPAFLGEDIGVSKACSNLPDSRVYRGRRRFQIPLSHFAAAHRGKTVYVFGVKHGTQTEYAISFGGIAGYTNKVP